MNVGNRFSVKEFSSIIKACFDNPNFSSLRIYGEVYSIKKGQITYIDLGDNDSKKQTSSPIIKCAINCYIPTLSKVNVGDVIEVEGKLSYYQHGCSLTLWVNDITLLLNSEGKAILEKRKTLEKLDKLGYLDPSRKRKIPKYCKNIAILTSDTGAVYHDILNTLKNRFPVNTELYPIIVQGDKAASSIVKAITKANEKDFDVILLGRGGGSKTDLACFDDEKVALSICESKIPVITCIGHTLDVAIADRVSDKQSITPTEGASYINPTLDEINHNLSLYKTTLTNFYINVLRTQYQNLNFYQEKLKGLSPTQKIIGYNEKLKLLVSKLDNSYKNILNYRKIRYQNYTYSFNKTISEYLSCKQNKLTELTAKIEKYNPEFIHKKGYVQLLNKGKLIKSVNDVNVNDEVNISFVDGVVKAVVKEK